MSRKAITALVAVGVLALPAIAIGSHQFSDVAPGNVFHDDIAWLADADITRGCNPPANTEFCPNDPVTRGQMAAFMKRFHDQFITSPEQLPPPIGLGYSERSSSTNGPFNGNGAVPGLALNLNIPESGLLVVTVSTEVTNDTSSDRFSCGINTGSAPNLAQVDSWRVIDLSFDVFETCSTQTAIQVNPGSQIVRLVITNADFVTEVDAGSIIAVLYPYESFGILGTASDEAEAPPLSDERKPKG